MEIDLNMKGKWSRRISYLGTNLLNCFLFDGLKKQLTDFESSIFPAP